MRSRAFVFVAAVLVAVPILSEAPPRRHRPDQGRRHHRRVAAPESLASPLDRLDRDSRSDAKAD